MGGVEMLSKQVGRERGKITHTYTHTQGRGEKGVGRRGRGRKGEKKRGGDERGSSKEIGGSHHIQTHTYTRTRKHTHTHTHGHMKNENASVCQTTSMN